MTVRVLCGDTRDILKTLPSDSIQCVVTSPPYYGLRSYLPEGHADKGNEIGLEQSPDEYVAELVTIFREVRRVLRGDSTLWLNIGDSYSSGGRGSYGSFSPDSKQASNPAIKAARRPPQPEDIKPKDLIGIPWMVAFALRADGWYLRADNVWGKPNGMPESCRDRTTRAHEYVFLLSKSEHYYYDHEAVRTAPKASTQTQLAKPYLGESTKDHAGSGVQDASEIKRRIINKARKPSSPKYTGAGDGINNADIKDRYYDKQRGPSRRHAGFNDRCDAMERDQQVAEGGNLRSVWWISPAQYKEAHFAVMPDALAEICIRAGCPAGGTVLDPFAGVFTTCLVADRLGRDSIGIELNPTSCDIARQRLTRDAGLFAEVE